MGYRRDLLSSRSVIKPGSFALIPPDGLVNNVIPFFKDSTISIVASPKIGASFVQYLVEFSPGGGNRKPFGGDGIEVFVYVLDGELDIEIDGNNYILKNGGYAFVPPNLTITMNNNSSSPVNFILYKQRYVPVNGVNLPWTIVSNIEELDRINYSDMKEVTLIDFLPSSIEFDMNFHILSFEPGASHPFIETHVQEHGAYLLSGEGVYNLGNEWFSVKKGDFIWMGPFVQQATYSIGKETLSYIYSKDCNRDSDI